MQLLHSICISALHRKYFKPIRKCSRSKQTEPETNSEAGINFWFRTLSGWNRNVEYGEHNQAERTNEQTSHKARTCAYERKATQYGQSSPSIREAWQTKLFLGAFWRFYVSLCRAASFAYNETCLCFFGYFSTNVDDRSCCHALR